MRLLLLLAYYTSSRVVAFASSFPLKAPSLQRSVSWRKLGGPHHHAINNYLWQVPSTCSTSVASTSCTGTMTARSWALSLPRGGALRASFDTASPQGLFNATLLGLAATTVLLKILFQLGGSRSGSSKEEGKGGGDTATKKPSEVTSLQKRFLAVFWLLRCADWLQGPYFYEVYASKILRSGQQASMSLVSRLFLTGFASTALFGPTVGRLADSYGRKRATLWFSVIYSIGALSTKSNLLPILFLGRVWSGIGTSLLFSAPESWLVGEASKDSKCMDYLGETFGLAYAGDAIVAILAGVMAGQVAGQRGPSGAFELSTIFLAAGGLLAAFLWKENKAESQKQDSSSPDGSDEKKVNNKKPTIAEALQVVCKDPKILLVGSVQSLFEAAMYIFVLQWPPAMVLALGSGASTPYGTIFSCFMACCLLGSTVFSQLAKVGVSTERFTAIMLSIATLSMSIATWTVSKAKAMSAGPSLATLVASFFVFEACVGMYFPSIGTLRSKYVPDSHRGVIMNLFGIPLNVLVVTVFLSISKLGLTGALTISSAALGVATTCMLALNRLQRKSKLEQQRA